MRSLEGVRCDYGRAARYKVTGQHAGERKCQCQATVEVVCGSWLYTYCTEHALAVAATAEQKWTFAASRYELQRRVDEVREPKCSECGQTIYTLEAREQTGHKHKRCPR